MTFDQRLCLNLRTKMQLLQTLGRKREGEFWRRCQWLSEVPLGCPAHTQNSLCPRQIRGYSNHCSKRAQTSGWGPHCAQCRSQTGAAVCTGTSLDMSTFSASTCLSGQLSGPDHCIITLRAVNNLQTGALLILVVMLPALFYHATLGPQ